MRMMIQLIHFLCTVVEILACTNLMRGREIRRIYAGF
jgi:hypothetical protein